MWLDILHFSKMNLRSGKGLLYSWWVTFQITLDLSLIGSESLHKKKNLNTI